MSAKKKSNKKEQPKKGNSTKAEYQQSNEYLEQSEKEYKENRNQDGPAAQNILPTTGMDENNREDDHWDEGLRRITPERWAEAQAAERGHHNFNEPEGIVHYQRIYETVFRFVGLGKNLEGLSVIEVGPADFPALRYCANMGGYSLIVEPMPSEYLEKWCRDLQIPLLAMPFEEIDLEQAAPEIFKEVWLFNVMQHIIDPDRFIEKAKALGHRIRFFEPINYPVSVHHPHAYTLEDFVNWFGNDCVNLYKGGSVPGFHQADCAYGVYTG